MRLIPGKYSDVYLGCLTLYTFSTNALFCRKNVYRINPEYYDKLQSHFHAVNWGLGAKCLGRGSPCATVCLILFTLLPLILFLDNYKEGKFGGICVFIHSCMHVKGTLWLMCRWGPFNPRVLVVIQLTWHQRETLIPHTPHPIVKFYPSGAKPWGAISGGKAYSGKKQ